MPKIVEVVIAKIAEKEGMSPNEVTDELIAMMLSRRGYLDFAKRTVKVVGIDNLRKLRDMQDADLKGIKEALENINI